MDLPDPLTLWSAWSRLAAALGVLGFDDVWTTTDDGYARHDDHGGSHAVLIMVEAAGRCSTAGSATRRSTPTT